MPQVKKKILLISIPSIHFHRWASNIDQSKYELYWLDILNRGYQKFDFDITQLVGIQNKENLSSLSLIFKIVRFLRRKLNENYVINKRLKNVIKTINPDVVHSFELTTTTYRIYPVLKKIPDLSWVYSCWGSDFVYHAKCKKYKTNMKQLLNRVNVLHCDCSRDYELSKEFGYKGVEAEVIPGGGGYNLNELQKMSCPIDERNIILVKGYEHNFGRAINVLKALNDIKSLLNNLDIVVFGCHQKTIDYISENQLGYTCYSKNDLNQNQLLNLMGKSLIYIGNSISDGIPNTLIEAIIMGAFPIQSNPGKATEELLYHGFNGLIIEDPEVVNSISDTIHQFFKKKEMRYTANEFNKKLAINKFEMVVNRKKINDIYNLL